MTNVTPSKDIADTHQAEGFQSEHMRFADTHQAEGFQSEHMRWMSIWLIIRGHSPSSLVLNTKSLIYCPKFQLSTMRKNISHFDIGLDPVHINYRLHGSIPKIVRQRIDHWHTAERDRIDAKLSDLPAVRYDNTRRREMKQLRRRLEHATDRGMHTSTTGPRWLAQPAIRTTVLDSWRFLAREGELELHAVCVMSNHVHVIVSARDAQTCIDCGQLMSRHKTFTAGACNKLLKRSGQSFWAKNYFDRTIRRAGVACRDVVRTE